MIRFTEVVNETEFNSRDHDFPAITTMSGNIEEVYVVVGHVQTIANRLSANRASLLKG